MVEVICDTSVLQYLHQLNKLSFLTELYDSVILPTACCEEIAQGIKLGIALPEVELLPWIQIATPLAQLNPPSKYRFGPGELQVIALGLERPKARLVLDDLFARRYAEFLNLKITGTLGVLLEAKTKGLLDRIDPSIQALRSLGFRLTSDAQSEILRLAGER